MVTWQTQEVNNKSILSGGILRKNTGLQDVLAGGGLHYHPNHINHGSDNERFRFAERNGLQ